MSLLVKASREGQTIARVTPDSAGWKHVGFAAYRLDGGDVVHVYEAEREVCIVVLTGTVDDRSGRSALGVDRQARQCLRGHRAVCAVFAAEASGDRARGPRERDRRRECAGDGQVSAAADRALADDALDARQRREHALRLRHSSADRAGGGLLVVEVKTPGGHASSYPPHKHDKDNVPVESSLEETYYHRLSPPQGFAFQRVYTDERDLDETMAVEDHDVVMVPRGYHPVVVPYGYDNYYLNVMAGSKRTWHFKNDPKHEWIVERDSKG